MERSAAFSVNGIYRYALSRNWDRALPRLMGVLLNPSDADSSVDDPTTVRMINFAKRWGYGRWTACNMYAAISSNPKILTRIADRIGPENDSVIAREASRADAILVAYGAHPLVACRESTVLGILRCATSGTRIYCLGLTRGGYPKHPLYLRADTELVPYLGREARP